MGTQGSLENHISAFEIGNSLCIQMALRAAIELDVFNIIAKAGPEAHLSSKEIVSQIRTSNPILAARNLERILNLLSVNSLLSTSLRPTLNDKALQEKTYGLTRNALCLVPNEDGVSFAPVLMFCSEMHYVQSLYMLKHTVLEPECSPFYKGHGLTFYEYMSTKPEMIQLFDKMMSITSYMYFDKKVLEVYRGFQELKELMDVGGGDGSSVAKIVCTYPHIHGINFNLPSIIDQAPKYQGVKHVKGDMFQSIPKTESIMLKWVLHNWDDNQCKKILKNCWEALPKTGKVVVVEYFVMPEVLENTPETRHTLMSDILMMTFFAGGKERTTAEFDNLAKSVGFIETKCFPISHGTCVIEFLKY